MPMRIVSVTVGLATALLLVIIAGRLPTADATGVAMGVIALPAQVRVAAAIPTPTTTTTAPRSTPTTAPSLSAIIRSSTTTTPSAPAAATAPSPPVVTTPTSTTIPPVTTPTSTTIKPFHDAEFAARLFSLANNARSSAGVPLLDWSGDLARHAAAWAKHLGEVGALGHSNLNSLLSNGWTSVGENVAMGHPIPAAMHQGWMASAGHRSNLLNPAFTHVGIAVWVDSAGTTWGVQVLGS